MGHGFHTNLSGPPELQPVPSNWDQGGLLQLQPPPSGLTPQEASGELRARQPRAPVERSRGSASNSRSAARLPAAFPRPGAAPRLPRPPHALTHGPARRPARSRTRPRRRGGPGRAPPSPAGPPPPAPSHGGPTPPPGLPGPRAGRNPPRPCRRPLPGGAAPPAAAGAAPSRPCPPAPHTLRTTSPQHRHSPPRTLTPDLALSDSAVSQPQRLLPPPEAGLPARLAPRRMRKAQASARCTLGLVVPHRGTAPSPGLAAWPRLDADAAQDPPGPPVPSLGGRSAVRLSGTDSPPHSLTSWCPCGHSFPTRVPLGSSHGMPGATSSAP
ncbi:uncharacterized protein [Heliangelus exortis]|uniref:uncharacterized protein n=1 Tax=Heliangelus exortis TaxID=472823 RepID=UPI003A8D5AA7